jgi:hypothetical protein
MHRRVHLASAAMITTVLGISLATLAAPRGPDARVPAAACAIPNAAQCLTPGYLDSTCGRERAQTCKPHVLAGLESNPARASAPKVKMLKPGGSDIPADLAEGARYGYAGPKQGRGMKRRAKNVLSATALTGPQRSDVKAANAAKFHRNPAWDSNGEPIASCAEYGYELTYDWSRFVDAAGACKGDGKCVVDVAFFKSTPGIARRKLKRRDGKELTPQIYVSNGHSFSKNEFFGLGSRMVYAGGPGGVVDTPELQALAAELDKGAMFYQLGCNPRRGKCKPSAFGDEWDFHEQLREATKSVSDAEFAEYARRKAKMRELLAAHDAAVRDELDVMDKVPGKAHRKVLPFDMVTADPFTRFETIQRMDAQGRKAAQRVIDKIGAPALGKLPGAGIKTVPVPAAAGGAQGALDLGRWWDEPRDGADESTSMPALGVLAAPKPPKPAAGGGAAPPSAAASKAKMDSCTAAAFKKAGISISEALGVGPISCQIGALLREEWARKGRGQKSCLDIANPDCDWSPAMFHARFVDRENYFEQQQRAQNECVLWTNDQFPVKADLTAMQDHIKALKKAVTTELVKLAPYNKGAGAKGKKFGDDLDDSEVEGDKDWFAMGYDYNLGWEVEPIEKTAQGAVCDLRGELRAGAGVDAWFLGGEVSVVDALGKARVNVEHPTTKKKSTRVVSHLRILGMDIFSPVDEYYAQAWTESIDEPVAKIPTPAPQFTVFIGPVPVTGAAWGELGLGADFAVKGVLKSQTCSADDVTFGAEGSFIPWVKLDARAQVGVGISGLLSAGVRATLNLITLRVPVEVSLLARLKDVAGQMQAALKFHAEMSMTLGTLSGAISLYLEFLFFTEEFELFSWQGIGPATIPLMPPLEAELPLVGMK